MSLLEAYKGIVSQVYKLTQLSYQHQNTINEFDSFLDHLQDVLEHKQQTIHIPPHVEIVNEQTDNVVVVKDDTVKNITIRHIPPSTEILADERLDSEMNELIPESTITSVDDTDDTRIAKDAIDNTLDEPIDVAQEIADAEAEGELAIAEEVAELAAELDKEEEKEPLTRKKYKGKFYFVAEESKRVYEYIDEAHHGPQVGKLQNSKIVLM